jgi:hypothetical protein
MKDFSSGEVFDVVVRQVTNAFGKQPPPPQIQVMPTEALPPQIEWRQVKGAFQLTVPGEVQKKHCF